MSIWKPIKACPYCKALENSREEHKVVECSPPTYLMSCFKWHELFILDVKIIKQYKSTKVEDAEL